VPPLRILGVLPLGLKRKRRRRFERLCSLCRAMQFESLIRSRLKRRQIELN
jgi:hypothetical protein